MAKLGADIARTLETERFVVLQGPVGSGKSNAVSLALEATGSATAIRVVPHAEDRDIDYAALEGVLDDPANPHASIIRSRTGTTPPLWVIDDFQLLDEASAVLIGWAVESGVIQLLASITHPDASSELSRLLTSIPAKHLHTGPLDIPAAGIVLGDRWNRPVAEWEAVLAIRFTAGNASAINALAGFAHENFPTGATPETWVEHLYAPQIVSYGPIIDHVEEIRQSLEPHVWRGLQIVATAGRLSPQQANQLLGRQVLAHLSESGLIVLDPNTSETRASSGLLDLGIRMHLGIEELRDIWDTGLGAQILAPGALPPLSTHLCWWVAAGLGLSREQVLGGARRALQNGETAPALALLDGMESAAAQWMRAEAQVLLGNGIKAGELAAGALEASRAEASPPVLGANEALVSIGSGLWPAAAGEFAELKGLDQMLGIIGAAMTGQDERVLAIGAMPAPGAESQLRQCSLALHAGTMALGGASESARALLAGLAPANASWSGITTQNVMDARCIVYLLNGDWDQLEESTAEGPTLHWAADRSGLSTNLRLLMGITSTAMPPTIDAEIPAPLGYHLLRMLARILDGSVGDPPGALRAVRGMLSEPGRQMPVGVELLVRGWELKLVQESGEVPGQVQLERLIELAGSCQGTLAHFLLLCATGLLTNDNVKLQAAATLAGRRGMGAWMSVHRPLEPVAPVLSAREAEIAEMVVAGATARSIADDLLLSVRTVEKHMANAYRKLGVSGREGLAAHYGASAGGR